MTRRLDYHKVQPQLVRAVLQLEAQLAASSLEAGLLHLVKLHASYINGCAYCVDMHTKDARHAGESEQRLRAVPVWREAPYFTERERAALEWTELLTRLSSTHVTDADFARVREHFSEQETCELTFAIVAINSWNRLAVGLGADVGSYQPPR